MLMLVAGLLGGMGIACLIWRRTLLGMLVGVQLLSLGTTMMFVLAGIASGARLDGQIVAIFVALGTIAQIVAGYALAIRLFYLRNKIDLGELRSLKN